GRAITDAFGVATVAGVSLAGLNAGTYSGAVSASFAGDTVYAASSASADLVVSKVTPIVTWPAPATVAFGTPLDGTQLNATSNVAGTFIYNPSAGTILPVGAGRVLSLTFTPFDTTNYTSVTATVTIDVVVGTPLFQTTDFGTYSIGQVETPLVASGGDCTYTWSVPAGSLPPGVSVRPYVPPWFPPTASASGFDYSSFRIIDGVETVFRGVGVNVYLIDISTPGQLSNATQNAPYDTTILATGGSGSYTFSTNGGLPNGLVFSSSGTISGSANTGPGRYAFNVTVFDIVNLASYTKTMSIDVIGVRLA